MPTPFTHLEITQRLLKDDAIPTTIRDELDQTRPAFLLGNVAADARVGASMRREDTHFYSYGQPIERSPWRVMLAEYPMLETPHDADHRAFIAGYVAHLSVDEYWTKHMTHPRFAYDEWGDRMERFYMLHILLITMDARDYQRIEAWQPPALSQAKPNHWLPFLPDDGLCGWRDLIHDQIKPSGESQTLEIFGGRISKTPAEMQAIVDDRDEIQARLWDHVPQADVAEIETGMYRYARQQLITYWETAS